MKSDYYFNINGRIGAGCYKNSDYRRASDLLAEMDRLGIAQSLACHVEASDVHPSVGNEAILKEIRETPGAAGRIFPVFSVSPNMTFVRHEMAQVEDHLAKGDVGFLELFPITHRYRLLEIERVLDGLYRYRPVVMIDIGEMNQSADMPDLAALADKFPEIKFVVKQFMWGQMSCVIDAMYRAENIYADISWLHSRDAIRMLSEQFSYRRLLFGLGFKSHGAAAVAALSYAEISQQARDSIAYDNLLSLIDTNKHRLPVLIHTWEGNWGTAKEVAETAGKYPEATIIFGHTGGGSQGRRECEEIARSPGYDNCVFEFCGSFCTDIEWPDTLKKIDYRRVVFGSDSYAHEFAWELGRLLSLDISDEILKAILADNMRNILSRRR